MSNQQGPGSGNRASGSITSVSANQIVIQTRSASENVAVSSSTTISQVVTGTPTDITTGSCVVARLASSASASDAAPLVASVSVTPQVNGACPVARMGRPNAGGAMPGGTSTSAPAAGGFVRPVSGVVTSASATAVAVTVTDSTGATSAATLTLDASTVVSVTGPATASALVAGQCLAATGATDNSGFTATAVTVSAPGASGCVPSFGGGGAPGGQAPIVASGATS